MKIYTININGNPYHIRASSAAVALHKAAKPFKEAALIRSSFIIVSSQKMNYQYFVEADVPCDPPGSRKRSVISPLFDTEEEATQSQIAIRDANPDYHFVRVQKREKWS